jgi:hypothetical protein
MAKQMEKCKQLTGATASVIELQAWIPELKPQYCKKTLQKPKKPK